MASYKQAIEWLADMDDNEWAQTGDYDAHGLMLSVAASMVRDLWKKDEKTVQQDLLKQIWKNDNKPLT